MIRRRPPRSVAELLARINSDHAAQVEKDATGWVVVVVDMETGAPRIGFTVGTFPTAAEAASEAERMDAEDRRWDDRDWLHLVAPVLRP